MKSLLLLDLTGSVFSRKEKILYWLISAFFLSLFLPDMPVVNNILIGATVLQSWGFNSFAEKRALLMRRKEIWMMILFFIFLIISAFASNDRKEAFTVLVLRLPLLVFPLCIGLLYIREELKDRILLSYCFFTTGAAVVCMFFAILDYRRTGVIGSLYDDGLTKAIGRPSVYIAIAINLALFTYVYLLFKRSFAIEFKGMVLLSIVFLVVFHYMLANRIALISVYGGFLVFAIWYYGRARKLATGLLLMVLLVSGVVLMMRYFPRTANKFRQLTNTGYARGNDSLSGVVKSLELRESAQANYNDINFRLPVWSSGLEVFRTHWLTGVPLGEREDTLIKAYERRQVDFAVQNRLNTHNAYLDVACNLGVVGLVVFVLGYLVIPLMSCVAGSREDGVSLGVDGLGLFIILAFGIAFCTENWLDRSIGCIMAGFFLSLVSAWKR